MSTLKKGIAIADREGYFIRGDEVKVEMLSEHVYRVHGKDPLGYPYNCLSTSKKIQVIKE